MSPRVFVYLEQHVSVFINSFQVIVLRKMLMLESLVKAGFIHFLGSHVAKTDLRIDHQPHLIDPHRF